MERQCLLALEGGGQSTQNERIERHRKAPGPMTKHEKPYDQKVGRVSGRGSGASAPPPPPPLGAGQFGMSRQQAAVTIKGGIDAIRVPVRLEDSV